MPANSVKVSGLVLAAFLSTASSCSDLSDDPGTIRVQAPAGKCWSGSIGDSSKEGCGNKSFKVEGEAIIVGVVQKQTPGRWRLRLTLSVGGKRKDTSSTTARFGIAQVSE